MTPPPWEVAGGVLVPRLLRDLLQSGLAVRLEVSGHSMTPFVRGGDVVTIAPRGLREPLPGDVVAYAAGADRLVVHRIVGQLEGRLLPRGDAAPSADPPIAPGDILGVVTRVERRGRRVRIGHGPERRAVAWLSRIGLLARLARLRAALSGRAPSAPA